MMTPKEKAELAGLRSDVDKLLQMRGVDPVRVVWQGGIPVVTPTPDQSIPVLISGFVSGVGISGAGVYCWKEQDYDFTGTRVPKAFGLQGTVTMSGIVLSGFMSGNISGNYVGSSGILSGIPVNPLYETNARVIASNQFPYYGWARRRAMTNVASGPGQTMGAAYEFDYGISGSAGGGGGGISGIDASTYSGTSPVFGTVIISGKVSAVSFPNGALNILNSGTLSGTAKVLIAGLALPGLVGANSGHQYIGLGTKEIVSGGLILRGYGCDANGNLLGGALNVAGPTSTSGMYYTRIMTNPSSGNGAVLNVGWGQDGTSDDFVPARIGVTSFTGLPSLQTQGHLNVNTSLTSGGSVLFAGDSAYIIPGNSGSSTYAVIQQGTRPALVGGLGGGPYCAYAECASLSGENSLTAAFPNIANWPEFNIGFDPTLGIGDYSGVTGNPGGYYSVFGLNGSLTGAGTNRKFAFASYRSDGVDFNVHLGLTTSPDILGNVYTAGLLTTKGYGTISASGAIIAGALGSGTVTNVNLTANSVLSGNIGAGEIGTPHIIDNAVTFAKMQDLSATVLMGSVAGGDPAEIPFSTFLQTANNLSEVTAATARTNLGLGTAAVENVGTFLQTANNLSDLANAATARTNLGLGTIATAATGDYAATANNLSDLTAASTARTNLGLGTIATENAGATGSFLAQGGETVTVANGIITSIV